MKIYGNRPKGQWLLERQNLEDELLTLIGTMTDVFALQDHANRKIVATLKVNPDGR
ncbi:MAG: hypothetical protein GY792_01590 [Gammaproteobacteria bacterium]|nr:hypothetical protein [Gammaproteobacteria bacterium]